MREEPNSRDIWEVLRNGTQGRAFLTGSSGTGKTTLCREIMVKALAEEWEIRPAATTGIAARNLSKEGRTIHSLLGMGICGNIEEYGNTPSASMKKLDIVNDSSTRVLLIIDEISMFSASQFELMLYIIAKKLGRAQVALLLVGDFLQLPAITHGPEINYCFLSPVFAQFQVFSLWINKRNTELHWNVFLNRIRIGVFDRHDYDYLSSNPNIKISLSHDFVNMEKPPIILFPKNDQVYAYNLAHLATSPEQYAEVKYEFELTDEFLYRRARDKSLTKWMERERVKFLKNFGDMEFIYKIGARVMITKNDMEQKVVNGDLGVITARTEAGFIIELDNGESVSVNKYREELGHPKITNADKQQIPLGFVDSFPLKLGYALSIHKSQGSSFSSVYFDFRETFAPSQTFVAISRLRTDGTLYLPSFDIGPSVFVDQTALAYQRKLTEY